MRIGMDVRMIGSSGIGTTIRGFLEHLSPDRRHQMVLLGSASETGFPDFSYEPAPYKIYGLRQHWSYGRFLNRQNLSLYHMPHFDVPLTYSGPLVVTVHDIIHYLFPQYSNKPLSKVYSGFFLNHVSKRAARIIVHSEKTKEDLEKYFPDSAGKIRVCYPAVNASFQPAEPEAVAKVLSAHQLQPGYILYVGNLRGSKNTRGLISAYIQARQKSPGLPPLVLAGQSSLQGIDFASLQPHVWYLGKVPHEHLIPLYSGASMFVFPSFYEGFGLPALEAMACGTPVIAARAGSLPEICGDAADYCEPHSQDSIAKAISELHASASRREEMKQKGLKRVAQFSWESFAAKTWGVYEEVLNEVRS